MQLQSSTEVNEIKSNKKNYTNSKTSVLLIVSSTSTFLGLFLSLSISSISKNSHWRDMPSPLGLRTGTDS